MILFCLFLVAFLMRTFSRRAVSRLERLEKNNHVFATHLAGETIPVRRRGRIEPRGKKHESLLARQGASQSKTAEQVVEIGVLPSQSSTEFRLGHLRGGFFAVRGRSARAPDRQMTRATWSSGARPSKGARAACECSPTDEIDGWTDLDHHDDLGRRINR